MDESWQRARTDEKKSERKDAIYEAAFRLFKENGFEKVSFNSIAVEAGFTKSNMYRYFSSKEEIFLNVFANLFEQWFEDYVGRLKKLKQNEDVNLFAQAWLASFLSQPKLLDLMPFLFVSLEKNSSFQQLLEFKRLSMGLLYQVSLEVSRIYPQIKDEKAFRFLTLGYAATATYWAANSQNDALTKLYQLDEFAVLTPNFEHDLIDSIAIIIRGLQASH